MFESFLLFNISKQINTQQNCAEGRQWHPIKQMSSEGKVGVLRQSSGWHNFLVFLLFFLGIFNGGMEL